LEQYLFLRVDPLDQYGGVFGELPRDVVQLSDERNIGSSPTNSCPVKDGFEQLIEQLLDLWPGNGQVAKPRCVSIWIEVQRRIGLLLGWFLIYTKQLIGIFLILSFDFEWEPIFVAM
jgi:hypothetical protein